MSSEKKPDDNILLMFLGVFPINDEHWNKYFETKDSSLYIVIHPMIIDESHNSYKELTNFIDSSELLKEMKESNKLLIVDKEHHVLTKWGTISLVEATLLMMQYSLMTHGNIFRKMILVDVSNNPLYNYKVMKEELISDDRSWLYFGSDRGGYNRNIFKKMYDYQGGIFTINDVTFMSQWMAIDKKHLSFYFDFENLPTYVKDKDILCPKVVRQNITIIKSVSPNTKYQKFIESHVGTDANLKLTVEELENIFKDGYCVIGDESYFGAVFKYHFESNEDFIENVKYNQITTLSANNKKEIIHPVDDEDKYLLENKSIYINYVEPRDKKCTTPEFGTWYGSIPKFNAKNLKYRIYLTENKNFDATIPENDENKKYMLVKNNKIIKITEEQKKLLESSDYVNELNVYEELTGGYSDGNLIINIKDLEKTYDHSIFNDKYTICSTYTDWSIVNVNPANMTRELSTNLFHIENKSFFMSGSVVKKPIDIINDESISTKKFIDNLLVQKDKLKMCENSNYVYGPGWHPMEYLLYSLKELINTYNLIVFFNLDVAPQRFKIDYEKAKEIYYNIIQKNISKISLYNEKYFILTDETDNIKNTKYGHPITSYSLNNALHYGALFIRKVMNNSQMNKYSEQLFAITKYVLKDTSLYSYTDRNSKYADIYSLVYRDKKEENFFNKYIKYKSKYTKLKNIKNTKNIKNNK